MNKVGAVLLAASAGVVNGAGYTVQRRALRRTGSYLLSWQWWLGFFMLIAAESMGGVSFAFLPASVVVALGSISVISNALFAFLFNGEKMTPLSITGTACVVVGAVYLAIVTPPVPVLQDADDYTAALMSTPALVFQGIALVFLLGSWPFLKRLNVYMLASVAAIVSSFTVIWFRPLLHILFYSKWDAFETFLPYTSIAIVAGTGAVAAAYVEPLGLKKNNQSVWVPIHFVACVIAFSIAAEATYQDWIDTNARTSAVFTLFSSLALIAWGVFLVPSQSKDEGTVASSSPSR